MIRDKSAQRISYVIAMNLLLLTVSQVTAGETEKVAMICHGEQLFHCTSPDGGLN